MMKGNVLFYRHCHMLRLYVSKQCSQYHVGTVDKAAVGGLAWVCEVTVSRENRSPQNTLLTFFYQG